MVWGFVSAPSIIIHQHCSLLQTPSPAWLHAASSDDNDNDRATSEFHKEWQARADQLQVEAERVSLEAQHTQSFLKRRPIKLPYEEAREWVQYNMGVDTQDEFDDLVLNGNLRTPYIPKRPEEYYTSTREWISWDHFLTGYHNNQNPSAIRPSDGILD